MSYSKTGHGLLPGVLYLCIATLQSQATTPASSDELVVTASKDAVSALDLFGNTAKDSRRSNRHHQSSTYTSTRCSSRRHLDQPRKWAGTSHSDTFAGADRARRLRRFLVLENSIPTRPVGFCNVNQLFELDTEQAQSIEISAGLQMLCMAPMACMER